MTPAEARRQNAPANTCPICLSPQARHGACDRCYDELSRSGDLLQPMPPKPLVYTGEGPKPGFVNDLELWKKGQNHE